MNFKFTDPGDPWTQARSWDGSDSDIHPQAPAGGPGPGRFVQAQTLGLEFPSRGVHPNSLAANTDYSAHIVLCAATTSGPTGDALVIRIGAVYKLEGFIEGEPVVYVGEGAEIKARIGSAKHPYAKLIRDPRTKISIKKVSAELDVEASGRGTFGSARNEALRSPEEQSLREAEQQAAEGNKGLKPGESPTTVLNKNRAAAGDNMKLWQQRHNVTADGEWEVIKEPGSTTIKFRAFIGLQILQIILDAILQERNKKLSQYVMAPYVFVERDGVSSFTVREETAWWGFSHTYTKHYIAGALAGQDKEIRYDEFLYFKNEGEALYGSVDFWGDFQPGLLMPNLPVVEVGPPGMRA